MDPKPDQRDTTTAQEMDAARRVSEGLQALALQTLRYRDELSALLNQVYTLEDSALSHLGKIELETDEGRAWRLVASDAQAVRLRVWRMVDACDK